MDFKYIIDGSINNEHVLGEGICSIDPSRGITEMNVDLESVANGWDPRTIVLMCCSASFTIAAYEYDGAQNLMSMANGDISIGRHLDKFFRHAVMRDPKGNILANIEASSASKLVAGQYRDASRIERGYSNLHPGKNGLAKIHPFSGVMMQAGPNFVQLMTRYSVETEDNNELFGSTFYPYYIPNQVRPLSKLQRFEAEVLSLSFSNRHLHIKCFTAVSAIADEVSPLTSAYQRSLTLNQ